MANVVKQFSSIIAKAMEEQGVSKISLQKKGIISAHTVTGFILRSVPISLTSIETLMDYLGLEVEIKLINNNNNNDNDNEEI